jgi:hypothetical protein
LVDMSSLGLDLLLLVVQVHLSVNLRDRAVRFSSSGS